MSKAMQAKGYFLLVAIEAHATMTSLLDRILNGQGQIYIGLNQS